MGSETSKTMYEAAKQELQRLMKQQQEIAQKIANWAPVVEHLAILNGETVSTEISNLASQAGQDLGLSDAIRWVLKQQTAFPMTPVQIRDGLTSIGYNLSKYASEMPPIHNTLKRLKDAGEIQETNETFGTGRAFRWVGEANPVKKTKFQSKNDPENSKWNPKR